MKTTYKEHERVLVLIDEISHAYSVPKSTLTLLVDLVLSLKKGE